MGLGFWLGIMDFEQNRCIAIISGIAALTTTTFGLIASVFHLRRPTRAWRALSQWRSSWLSREGILAMVTSFALFLFVVCSYLETPFINYIGLAVSALCLITVYATSMIYAQLRAVPAWNTFLTPSFFLLFAGSSGLYFLAFLWSLVDSSIFQPGTGGDIQNTSFGIDGFLVPVLAFFLNAVAWLVMLAWWIRRDKHNTGRSSTGSATRLSEYGRISHLQPPHTEPNYLTQEMGFQIAAHHARKLRIIAALIGCLLPIALGFVWHLPMVPDTLAFMLMLILHMFGIAVARWLFFAESKHTVSLYYSN